MAYLRLVQPPAAEPAADHECVQAFDRELDYIFGTLRRLGAPPGDVEDLAHNVFLVLLKNWAELDRTRPLRPYLFAIAFRIVRAHRRRRLREVPRPALDATDGGPSPEWLFQTREDTALLHAALEQVPLTRRAVLVMHELDGVPIAEVAKALSITRFGAYARLRKGHRELAAAMKRLQRPGARP
jgi:RNA polymerase sigma-70 factor (ECF subfamily)